jgi:2,4-dienoyl-CoA reductase-like NADH-dependent reductase (Old Yellow Enzyme family)
LFQAGPESFNLKVFCFIFWKRNTMSAKLFSAFRLRDLEFRNRIFVSPMCQYSAVDGVPNDWHLVHLGSRAVGGAGLVIVEATGINAIGRISPGDLGIWNDAQVNAFKRITGFIAAQGAHPGIQLAHAGRKASTPIQWLGEGSIHPEIGGWIPVAPSAIPFAEGYTTPHELTRSDMATLISDFAAATQRALEAGFKVIEIQMAHGYLIHEFLSPLSNHRKDEFGGDLDGRMKFPLQVARAVREKWPKSYPLFVRISSTDWTEGGWDLEQSVAFSRRLKEVGVDLIDCSSGGNVPGAKIPLGPSYQVRFAAAIRKQSEIPTAAVGLITEPQQAEDILQRGDADVIVMARAFLRDPYWPLHAAIDLSVDLPWPVQYGRAKPKRKS